MPKYIIRRNLPGAGRLSSDELRAISQKSVEVLDSMAPRAQWVQSFVTDDHIFCVYLADSVATIREHGDCGGFPVHAVHEGPCGHRPDDGQHAGDGMNRGRLIVAGVVVAGLAVSIAAAEANDHAPAVDGHHFHLVTAPNRYDLPAFYQLHVWAWRNNPSGDFNDWNPKVTCPS